MIDYAAKVMNMNIFLFVIVKYKVLIGNKNHI